jgi:uncharacterized protein
MTLSTFSKLCCPVDKSDLELNIFLQDIDKNIIEGLLTCSHCKRYYPIIHGVPVMSPDEYREKELELPLIKKWQHQLNEKMVNDHHLLPQ